MLIFKQHYMMGIKDTSNSLQRKYYIRDEPSKCVYGSRILKGNTYFLKKKKLQTLENVF